MSVVFVALLVAAPCDATIDGRVLDGTTSEPVPRASVKLADGSTTTTDEDGRFVFEARCPGRVSITFRRADYEPTTGTVGVPSTTDILLEPRVVTRVDDVIVEAPRLDRTDTRSTSRLDAEALDRARGKGLADSIAEVPSVTVLRSGGTSKPMVRGLSGPRLLVLFDGVRHASQDWGLDHGTEIDPFAAGSIEVVKGAAGVRYGPDAIAGVLLVNPHPLRTDPGVSGAVQLVGALNGRRGTVAGRVDAAPVEGLSLRLEGNYGKGRALEAPDYPLDNTGLTEWNAGATARYSSGDYELKLSYAHHDLIAGICACLNNETNEAFRAQLDRERPRGVELYSADYAIDRPYQDVTHDRLAAHGRWSNGGAAVHTTYAFQINRRQEFDVVRRSIEGPQFDFTLRTHTLDVAYDHVPIDFETWTLEGTVGVSATHQENVYKGLPLIPNYRGYAIGAFVIERLVTDDLQLEAGVRYDRRSRDAFLSNEAFRRNTLTEDDCDLAADVAACTSVFDTASLSLGGVFTITSWLDARVDLSTASRMPTIDEQYINGTAPSFPVFAIGDPKLGTETSWTLSTTFDAVGDTFAIQLGGFLSYIDDYIFFAPAFDANQEPIVDVLVRGTFPRFTHRATNAIFYGAEFDARYAFGAFGVAAQASLVRAKDVTNGAFLTLVPPDRARVAATYRLDADDLFVDTAFTANVSGVRRQNRFDSRTDLAQPPDAYVLLGLGATTTLAWATPVTVSLDVENLLDTAYRDYTSLLRYFADEPGRQVYLRVGTRW